MRVKCGEWLRVGDVIAVEDNYRSRIGTITWIDPSDANSLRLDDGKYKVYHHANIQKLQMLENGVLVDNPTATEWREVAEFLLEPGRAEEIWGGDKVVSYDVVTI